MARQLSLESKNIFIVFQRWEIGRYFGMKGPAVSEVAKGIEGRLEEEIQLRKEI